MDFPNSPALGATFSIGIRFWRFNGNGWERIINAGQVVAVLSVLDGPFVQLVLDPLPSPMELIPFVLLTHI